MANYQTIKLDKSMYRAGIPFTVQLEKLDPSAQYAGGELAGLDAFERQLKRFDIKVSGAGSDTISKFGRDDQGQYCQADKTRPDAGGVV